MTWSGLYLETYEFQRRILCKLTFRISTVSLYIQIHKDMKGHNTKTSSHQNNSFNQVLEFIEVKWIPVLLRELLRTGEFLREFRVPRLLGF